MNRKMTPNDYRIFDEIIENLGEHHSVFNALAGVGYPIFDDTVGTACVGWDANQEKIIFRWDPKFWDNSSVYDKTFTLSHEMLHVILDHLKRVNFQEAERSNRAADVVVNHNLINSFGFNRRWITNSDQLCWTDTVFPGKKVADDLSYEEYFSMINPKDSPNVKTVDNHAASAKNSITPDQLQKAVAKAIQNGDMNRADMKDLIKGLNAGDKAGAHSRLMPNIPLPPNPKWETVIEKWTQMALDPTKINDRWDRKHIATLATDCILPKSEAIEYKRDRIDVCFFLDTSGSCVHLADRFFKAAKTLDPAKFKVRLCCFDTQAYDVIDGQLKGFGGTSFDCIENHIQQIMKNEDRPYPSAVFIITDGYGSPVTPEYPDRWKWFLSENYTQYIPAESSHYPLKDYE